MLAAAPSFYLLLVGVFFFGFSLGLMGVIQNALLVQEVPPGPLKNRLLVGLHSMYAGASLLAPVLVNAVAWFTFNGSLWRVVFLVGAAISSLALLSTFVGSLNIVSTRPQRESKIHTGEKWAQIYFGVMLSAYVLSEILVSTRMALYMRREFQSDLSESTWYTALFFVALFVGRVVFSFWAPSMKIKSQMLLSLFLAFASLLVGIYRHPMGLALSGLFMAPFYPLMMSSAGHLFPYSVAEAVSWAMALSSLFIVAMHFSVGLMTDFYGLQIAFLLAPAFILTSFVMILLYEKIFRRLQHSF
jgi:MFS family permease